MNLTVDRIESSFDFNSFMKICVLCTTLHILDLMIDNSFDLVHLWQLSHIYKMSEQLHSIRPAFEVPMNLCRKKECK